MSRKGIRGRDWSEIAAGDELPEVRLPITYDIVVGHIAGTRDWFPGHHNPEYAKAQGQENVYANTMFFQGFLERVALEWAGPAWFVSDRSLRINSSVYPGDVLVGTASVDAVGETEDGKWTVDLQVLGRTRSDAPAISGRVQISMTQRSRRWWTENR